MARIQLTLPETFAFTTKLPLRITDLNYGAHLGNDAVLGLLHEARMQFLQSIGYTELNIEGLGLLMADAAIEFKAEAFYGDVLVAEVTAGDFTRVGFDVWYRLRNEANNKIVVQAKTGMVCFDYGVKKLASVPVAFAQRFQ